MSRRSQALAGLQSRITVSGETRFDKFIVFEGRPYNPHTTYHAYDAVVEHDGEILYELKTIGKE